MYSIATMTMKTGVKKEKRWVHTVGVSRHGVAARRIADADALETLDIAITVEKLSLLLHLYKCWLTYEQVPLRLGFHAVNCAHVTFVAEAIVKHVSLLWIS
jgi:hypothetical protein